MITHERLKELIEQESGCYVLNDYNIGYIHLKPKYEPETYENGLGDYILYIYCNDKKEYKEEIFSEQLFETEEDANWHKDFGCIERTERLELPTWEEIKKDFENINKFGSYAIIDTNGVYMDIFVDNYAKKFIVLTTQPRMPLTKENYILACRKVKELFLGEE
jgi:hypothetical protein